MRILTGAIAAVFLLAGLTACGDDDSSSTPADSADASVTGTQAADEDDSEMADEDGSEVADEAEPETATEDDDSEAAPPSGEGSASLTLSNGEVFEFGIRCVLEPQVSAGSEILFTVVSYDDPYNLDVTQFGDSAFNGAANISVYDSDTYDTLWEASSMLGTSIELSIDGSTVTGVGDFLAGGEPGGETVTGDLVANC